MTKSLSLSHPSFPIFLPTKGNSLTKNRLSHSPQNPPPNTTPSTTTIPNNSTKSSSSSEPKMKNIPKNQAPKSLLSFIDNEEEEEETQTQNLKPNKPSSSSHKITSTKNHQKKSSLTPLLSNVRPQAGTYTKEALLELQKNTRILPKPTSINIEQEQTLKQGRDLIPDHISLDGGIVEGLSDEELEFRERIANAKKKGVFEDDMDYGLKKNSCAAHIVGYGYVEEEEKNWEEEQFRKGLGKRMDDGCSRVVSTNSANASVSSMIVQQHQQQQQMYMCGSMPSVAAAPTSIGGAVGASQGLDDVMSISQQADIARKAMQDYFRRLKETHEKTVSSLMKIDQNLSTSLLNITALGKSLSAAREKILMRQMRPLEVQRVGRDVEPCE